MLEVTTTDTFEIEGRGTVHTVDLPVGTIPPDIKAGDRVVLDGQEVEVRGVEMYAKIWK